MYLWKLPCICCCVTPSGGHWAMFLLRWLRRTADGFDLGEDSRTLEDLLFLVEVRALVPHAEALSCSSVGHLPRSPVRG